MQPFSHYLTMVRIFETHMYGVRHILQWMLATIFVSIRLAFAEEAGIAKENPATNLPPAVMMLLESQGSLEAGRYLLSTMVSAENDTLNEKNKKACDCLGRIYPACRAILSKDLEDRVCASLQDTFQSDIAAKIRAESNINGLSLAPVYPSDFTIGPNTNRPKYGIMHLIQKESEMWSTPELWSGTLQTPSFVGWEIESDKVTINRDAQPLVRSDFRLDDAEITGEVSIDEGEAVFMILRSDIVLKFQGGKVRGSGGNLNVKFGFDNLRTSSLFSNVPELQPGQWYEFRVSLQDNSLKVLFDNTEAINTIIAKDPRITASKLVKAGYFGFGCNRAAGGFRNVRIKALTPWGMHSMPRLQRPLVYSLLGSPVHILEGATNNFITLIHGETGPYDSNHHRISGGILSFDGAPYSQFSRRDLVSDHFIASGKIRFFEKGSVWFRVNSGLLFGLRCQPSESPVAVKHSTSNFNNIDEQNTGEELKIEQEYSWELEYHEPVGTFKLNGKPVISSVTSFDQDRKKAGTNQFGISSYNTKAEISDVAFHKLISGSNPDSKTIATAERFLDIGLSQFEKALTTLKEIKEIGCIVACGILEGKRPPVTADAADIIQTAGIFRKAGDWPTYLEILEANVSRFRNTPDQRRIAEDARKSARKEYDDGIKSIGKGQIGLDNILRTGEKPVTIFADIDGRTVHIFIPETKELLHYDSLVGSIVGKTPLEIWPGKAICRNGYFLCTKGGDPKELARNQPRSDNDNTQTPTNLTTECIYKVDPKTGAVLAKGEIQGRIMDMTEAPGKGRIFVSVDENTEPNVADFSLLKIHLLDESTMKAVETDAIGMFLATDPLGRYLYAGFHAIWAPQFMIDGAFLQIRPCKGHIDHLVRYRLTPNGPVYDGQKAAPGIGGRDIVCNPNGDTICYVAMEAGGEQPKEKDNLQFGMSAYDSTDLNNVAGIYEAGGWTEFMGFNPINTDLYICAGNQVRRFDSSTFRMKNSVQLPQATDRIRVTSFSVMPSGRGFMAAFSGKSSGVYIHRFPAGITTNEALSSVSGASQPAQSVFSQEREVAAKQLLEKVKSPYITQTSLYQIPILDIKDRTESVNVESLTMPDSMDETNFIAGIDPVYTGNSYFLKKFTKLNSLKIPAETFPFSCLCECHQAELEFPGSPLLKLNAALWLEKSGNDAAASVLLQQVLTICKSPGKCSFDAYYALARIYEKKGDLKRAISALTEAIKQQPRDAAAHKHLGSMYAAAGYPQASKYHKLMSWRLFPGRLGLVKELTDGGVLPAKEPGIVDTATLFRQSSQAVILISHKRGNGTGFIISRNGLALTNFHVVEGAKDLVVKSKDADGIERTTSARVVASDAVHDIALVSLLTVPINIKPLLFGDSNAIKTGDGIVAIGNPGMGSKILMNTATEGIISASDRMLGKRRYLQISAPVNPGNSGGPLLDHYGQVVGMVTLKAHLENVGFAVPSTELLSFIEAQNL